MSFLKWKVTRIYEVVAFNTFNVIVLIILVNLVLAGIFFVKDSFQKKEPPVDQGVDAFDQTVYERRHPHAAATV